MQVEYYEPTERDILRSQASFATPEGKRDLERYEDRMHIATEYRIRKEGFVLPPEEMAKHNAWLKKRRSK